jgi:hypothetical protein
MKMLVWLIEMVLSIGGWIIAYKYARKRQMWLPPANFAIIVAALILVVCGVIIVWLDKLGWYPD